MRHRARRPFLDFLHRLVATPRIALLGVAVLLVGTVTGGVLVALQTPDSPTAGAAVTDGPGSPYDASEPTDPSADGSPSRSADPSRKPSPSTKPPTAPRDAEELVSRSADRLPSPTLPDAPSTTVPPPPERSTAGSSTPAPSPTVDSPQTTAATRSANANKWTVTVAADEQATYECSLDGGGYAPCGTTVTYNDLDEGTHTFAARATDTDGNTDPSPAQLTTDIQSRGG